jgi:hypothetical protein
VVVKAGYSGVFMDDVAQYIIPGATRLGIDDPKLLAMSTPELQAYFYQAHLQRMPPQRQKQPMTRP